MKPGGTAAASEVGDCWGRSGHSLRYDHSILTTSSPLSTLQAKLAMGVTLIHHFSQDRKDNVTLLGLQFGQVLEEKLVACIHFTAVNYCFFFYFQCFIPYLSQHRINKSHGMNVEHTF